MAIFEKLADKKVSGCRWVVVADGRNLGHFGVAISLSHGFCLQQFWSPLMSCSRRGRGWNSLGLLNPGNCGVFRLLKEVAFRIILAFYNSRKWGRFRGDLSLFHSFRLLRCPNRKYTFDHTAFLHNPNRNTYQYIIKRLSLTERCIIWYR